MYKLIFSALFLAFFHLTIGMAQAPAVQGTLLAHWNDTSIPPTTAYNNPYNETWGFEVNGQEYGVIGSTLGLHVFNLSQNKLENPKFLPGASAGSFLIHRDFKDHKGFLYAVADEYNTAKLQIFDLRSLPDTIIEVYKSNEFVVTSHNLFIDTSMNRLYLLGAGSKTKVLDITNPANPVLLKEFPNATLNLPYTHDGYIRDNIGYFNCGTGQGLWIVDLTDLNAPIVLGKFQSYTGKGYNHSGWLATDKKTYYMLDETHGSPLKAVSVEDFTDMNELSTFNAQSTVNQIPHNALLRGNYCYVSYYYDGLQVFDVSNPAEPRRAAFYPTSTIVNNNSYQGAWGVHPLAKSGRILVSDMQTGLWLFESMENTVSQKNITEKFQTFYPNPVSKSTSMIFAQLDDNSQGMARISIQDMLGRQVMQQEVMVQNGKIEYTLPVFASGTYHFLVSLNGKMWSEKIVLP